MPNSKADAATPAPAAGAPGAEAKDRPDADDQASTDAPTPKNGITITRLSLTLAVAVLGGAFTLVWNRTSGIEDQVRDLRGELHTEINGLRQEVRADIRDLRHEMRTEIGTLREEMRADIGALRDQVQELAILIRTRDAAQ